MAAKNTVYGLSLDASKFVKAIKDVKVEVQDLQKILSKKLTVQIDKRQFDNLKATLSKEFDGLGEGFRKAMEKSTKQVVSQLGKLKFAIEQIGEQGGDSLGAKMHKGVSKGVAGASATVKTQLPAAFSQAEAQVLQDLDRFEARVNAVIARNFRKLSSLSGLAQQQFQAIAASSGINFSRDFFVGQDKKGEFVNPRRQEMVNQGMDNARQIDDNARREDEAFKRAIKLKEARYKELDEAQEKFQRRMLARDRSFAREQAAAARDAAVQQDKFGTAMHRRDDTFAAEQARRKRDLVRETNKFLNDQMGAHKSIGASLATNVVTIAKWLVLYRLIYDIQRLISTAVSQLVTGGINYAKALETQRLGLQGVLAENYKITDAQGNQLTGAAALAVLGGEAEKQWRTIQGAAMSVVGTTEDLMVLYSGVLPFASKLGKNLEDVQKMTQSAAVAASLLGVSFSDARSAMIAMLQGRALTRNRLVGILGFTPKDLADLKNTPELFDRIQGKLDEFLALAPEARKTVAATAESFRDMAGMVGFGFVQPLTDSFQRLVNMLQDSLFVLDQTGTLLPTREFRAFLAAVSEAVETTFEPLKAFGREILEQSRTDLPLWINGAIKMVQPLVSLAQVLTNVAIRMSRFVALNYEFLKALGWVALVITGSTAVVNLASALNRASQGATLFGAALRLMTGTVQTNAAATQAAEAATMGWSRAIRGLAAGSVIGIATVAIGTMIQRLMRWRAEAQAAKAVAEAIDAGQTDVALRESEQLLASPDTKSQAQGATVVAAAAMDAFRRLEEMGLSTQEAIIRKGEEWRQQIANINTAYEEIARTEEGLRKKGEQLTDQDRDRRGELLKQLADIKAQKSALDEQLSILSNASTRANRLDRLASNITVPGRVEVPGATGGANDDFGRTDALASNAAADAAQRQKTAIEGAARALRNLQDTIMVLEQARDMSRELTLEPIPGEPDEEPKRPKFIDTFNEAVSVKRAQMELQAELDQLAIAKREMLQEDAVERQEQREIEFTDFLVQQLLLRQEQFLVYKRRMAAFAEDKTDGEKSDIQDLIEQTQADINRDFSKASKDAQSATLRLQTSQANRKAAFEAALDQYADGLEAKEAEISHRVGDAAAAQFQKVIDQITAMVPASPLQAGKKEEMLRRAEGIMAALTKHSQLERDIKLDQRLLSNLARQESLLNQQFEFNTISASAYADELIRLTKAKKAALLSQQSNLEAERTNIMNPVGGGEVNESELENVEARLAEITAQLLVIDNVSEKIRRVFQAWESALSAASGFLSVFDGLNDSISGFANGLSQISQSAGQFGAIVGHVKEMRAHFLVLKESMGPGGFNLGSIFGSIGGAQPGQAASGFQKAIGMLTVAGTAAGVAIGIASAAFRSAVERAKRDITNSVKGITDALDHGRLRLSNGARLWGQALVEFEAERNRALKRYGGSKSGRAALKEMLPDLEKQIQDVQARIADIRSAFDQKLNDVKIGSGPFGEFARMLFDLEKVTSEYLATFVQGTDEYAKALANIQELYDITLQSAKDNLENQMLDFEGEAISSAQNVISLLDQQQDLMLQVEDIADRRQELAEARADLAEDTAQAALDFEEERRERAERILDLEKEIADVIRQAADDEAEIRQRGVLEATQTVAQQKARDISGVRNSAADRVADLNKQLGKEKDTTDFDKRVRDTEESFQKRAKDLDKQAEAMERQNTKLLEQIQINAIQLQYAQAIAQLEGAMFGISGDRFDLERRRGEIEFAQAQAKVDQWRQVQALIDSIVDTGSGVVFTPPPGFPQIHVNIGDIVIDNTSISNNSTTHVPDPESDGSGNGGGWSEGKPRPRPRTPDVVRQYGDFVAT